MSLPPLMTSRRRAALFGLVLNGFLQAAASLGIVGVVDAVVSSEASSPSPPMLLAATSVGLGVALFALRVLQRRQGEGFALDYVREIRVSLVEHLLSVPTTQEKTSFGLAMTRLITDLSAIKSWLADGVASLFVSGPSTVLILVGAFWLAPTVAPYLAAAVTMWLAMAIATLPFLRRAIRESRRHRGRLAAHLGHTILSHVTLSHFGRSGPTMRKTETMSETLNQTIVERATWSGVVRAASDLVTPLIVAAVITATLLQSHSMNASDLSILLLLAGLTVSQLAHLARAADYRLAFLESRRRIASALSVDLPADPESPTPLPRSSCGRAIGVEIRASPADAPAVYYAPAGTVVTLYGSTPAIRSAVLAAIAGLADSPYVRVTLDEIALHDVSRRDRRRAITLVSPVIPLTCGTVKENIAIGALSKASAQDIAEIAESCGLQDNGMLDHRITAPLSIDPFLAARIRAARALARGASIVLVDDTALIEDKELLAAFLSRALSRGITVIISCAGPNLVPGVHHAWSLEKEKEKAHSKSIFPNSACAA